MYAVYLTWSHKTGIFGKTAKSDAERGPGLRNNHYSKMCNKPETRVLRNPGSVAASDDADISKMAIPFDPQYSDPKGSNYIFVSGHAQE